MPDWVIRRGREAFIEFVYDALLEMERHECDEWFRVDGEQIHDPHTKAGSTL